MPSSSLVEVEVEVEVQVEVGVEVEVEVVGGSWLGLGLLFRMVGDLESKANLNSSST